MLNRYGLRDALRHRDIGRGRELVHLWRQGPGAPDYSPLNLCYVAQFAALAKDAELRNFVISHTGDWKLAHNDGIDYREGIALTWFYIGLAFLPDTQTAKLWFDKALEAVPGLRPARIEHDIITRGLDRDAIMGGLGEDLPYPAWHYELAAAELGFPPDGNISQRSGKSKVGVGIRGRSDERTPALMRLYRRAIGTDPLLICTWDDTDPAILAELRNICDEVILIPDPEDPGFGNRARQISQAQALLNACAQSCEMTLMTRTDIALFRPNILAALAALWHQYPTNDDRVRGRIVIPNVYTRRFSLDHPSDMIMYRRYHRSSALLVAAA